MVTRVWGKADFFELVFTSLGGDRWNAVVPPDLQDGQYVLELYCQDDHGNIAFWTGILYLSNADGVKISISADKFKLWLKSECGANLLNASDPNVTVKPENELKLIGEPLLLMKGENIIIQITSINYVGGR